MKLYTTASFFTLMLLLAGSIQAFAQNHPVLVQQEIMLQSNIKSDGQIIGLTASQKQTTRTYFDGLGRVLQTVQVQASPLQNDFIQPVSYDNAGRQTVSYLPYTGSSTDTIGSYRSNATNTAQAAFYNNTSQHTVITDQSPYSQQVFENSPLQRLLSTGMAGSGYQPAGSSLSGGTGAQHYKSVGYRSNNSSDGNILIWNPDGTFTAGNYYPANSLSVTAMAGEDNVKTFSFTDMAGHTILKREIFTASVNYDTYYVFNNAGTIAFVIPPKAMALMYGSGNYSLSQTNIASLIFSFAYNAKGLIINKTVPGKGMMNIIYDPLERPVLLQDANLAANFQWNYIKYDVKGRAISQGIYTDATHSSQSALQTTVSNLDYSALWYEKRNSASTTGYYTNSVFPSTGITPLAYSYYDNYNLIGDGATYYSYSTAGLPGEAGATLAQVKGMPTMILKSTVSNSFAVKWLLSVNFYDKNLNLIQVKTNNLLNYTNETTLTDTKTMVPDFVGMPVAGETVKVTGSLAANTITVVRNITYDHNHRVSNVTESYNGAAPVEVAAYNYNELGQTIAKQFGVSGTSWLQQIDFRYNIHGQLTNINNSQLTSDGGVTNNDSKDLFGMQLIYDQTDATLGNTAYFDGKLSAVKWMSKDGSNNYGNERSYLYTYDALDRYTGAIYGERGHGSSANFTTTHGWDETITAYDENGNIQHLNRNATTAGSGTYTQIDNLTYVYATGNYNQLYRVTDGANNQTGFGIQTGGSASGNYTYDVNGNLVNDPYKAFTNSYNVVNHLDKINITGVTGRYINYIYDADGNMIKKQLYDANTLITTTDYIDGFVYTNGTLSYFPMAEGRTMYNAGAIIQEYIISDQQGNARVSFNNTGTGGAAKVVQENSYYGFGMLMPGSTVSGDNNKNLYNGGSEWQNDYQNMPDYYRTFNRNYDAALGRFIGVDPVAESAESMTSYQYANNDPIMYNDPLGNVSGPGAPYYGSSGFWNNIIHGNSSGYPDGWDPDAPDWVNFLNASPWGNGTHTSGGGGGRGGGGFTLQTETNTINTLLSASSVHGGTATSAFPNDIQEFSTADMEFDAAVNIASTSGVFGNSEFPGASPNKAAAIANHFSANDIADIIGPYVPSGIILQTVYVNSTRTNDDESSKSELAGAIIGEADNALTIAGGIHYMRFGKEATGLLKWAGDVTGAAAIGNNLYKAWNERRTNRWQAALHTGEAVTQTGIMVFGGEEVELLWNLGSIAIDSGVDYYNHSKRK